MCNTVLPRADASRFSLPPSALNIGNSLGGFIGGATIAAGFGLRSPG